MAVTFTFDSMAEMADFIEAKAKSVRSRVSRASTQSQRVMQAEAHAYEQSASIIRNAVIEDAERNARLAEAAEDRALDI